MPLKTLIALLLAASVVSSTHVRPYCVFDLSHFVTADADKRLALKVSRILEFCCKCWLKALFQEMEFVTFS